MASMYKLVQTINSTKFRTEPFEDFYEVTEEIGRYSNVLKKEVCCFVVSLVVSQH